MSASFDLQAAVFDLLRADVGVTAIVGQRIYDNAPPADDIADDPTEDAGYPCVTFGPSDVFPDDVACVTGRQETLQVDCWVQKSGQLGPARQLADAVKAAVHKKAPDLQTHALSRLVVTRIRVVRDPDGITGHGIVTVEAETEER